MSSVCPFTSDMLMLCVLCACMIWPDFLLFKLAYLVFFFFAGDYDGALSVFTEMQLMCQERGLQLPGTSTPVGETQHLSACLK